jgi:membrane associated rhomboid family serine protease
MQTCYRHPDRETRVACSRCDRPICPECMTPSPVGMRCPECAGERSDVRKPSYSSSASSANDAPATYALIAINVAVFVAQLALGGGATDFDGTGLTADGALCGDAIGSGGLCGPPAVLTDGGEWWRIFTSGFLHGGFIHLALNMFVLYILGTLLEPAIGTRRLLGIYFVSLVAGSFGALLLSEPFRYTVGASGAIYGLFGATLLVARNRGLDQVVTQLGFWLVLNLVLTFSISGISIGGHLGGLAGGALAGMVVLAAERRSARVPVGFEIAALAALGTVAFVACLVVAGGSAGPG